VQEARLVDEHGNFVQPIVVDRLEVWVAPDVMAYAHFLEGAETPRGRQPVPTDGATDDPPAGPPPEPGLGPLRAAPPIRQDVPGGRPHRVPPRYLRTGTHHGIPSLPSPASAPR
jgi:hypothetical protein